MDTDGGVTSERGPERFEGKPQKRCRRRVLLLVTLLPLMGLVAGWLTSVVFDFRQLAHYPKLYIEADKLGPTSRLRYSFPVRLSDLPPHVPKAFLAIEDHRFHEHHGVELRSIARAVRDSFRTGVLHGASTITQQTVKNLYLSEARTLRRKLAEAVAALALEICFSKEEILEAYLNNVYFGSGHYGIEAAARGYFGTRAAFLNRYQAAVLAGVVKAPSRNNPSRNREIAHQRAKLVLQRMVEVGYLSSTDRNAALHTASLSRRGHRGRIWDWNQAFVRYAASWVFSEVMERESDRPRAGYPLVVTLTIDPVLQVYAEHALEVGLRNAASKGVSQGAIVVMSKDGAVRAMVGGRDFVESQWNRATQARRQPGSAFKLPVYLAALKQGLLPTSMLDGGRLEIDGWRPRNVDNRYPHQIALGDALTRSVNTATVRLAMKVGLANVIETARSLGIESDLPNEPSVALGTGEVTLLELTAAYATIANGGIRAEPYGYTVIRDRAGRSLTRPLRSSERVVDADMARQTELLLTRVIDDPQGTGHRARILPCRCAAGKTGTSQSYRDAWFIGYTADLVVGVWLGNDDDSPTHHVSGGQFPAEIWQSYLRNVYRYVLTDQKPRILPERTAYGGMRSSASLR